MYRLTQDPRVIQRIADGANIPTVVSNRDYVAYLAWVAAGNTPLPAAPAPAPIDYSNSDNIDRTLKAILLCVAQVGGLTPAQIRAMFKNKFDQLA
jgi:hypothetical protein